MREAGVDAHHALDREDGPARVLQLDQLGAVPELLNRLRRPGGRLLSQPDRPPSEMERSRAASRSAPGVILGSSGYPPTTPPGVDTFHLIQRVTSHEFPVRVLPSFVTASRQKTRKIGESFKIAPPLGRKEPGLTPRW